MLQPVRTLLAVLLVAFAAATVVHAAGSTAMGLEMALTDANLADDAPCQDCGDDPGNAATCNIDCGPLAMAKPEAPDGLRPPAVGPERPDTGTGLAGHTGPPERRPPKPAILS